MYAARMESTPIASNRMTRWTSSTGSASSRVRTASSQAAISAFVFAFCVIRRYLHDFLFATHPRRSAVDGGADSDHYAAQHDVVDLELRVKQFQGRRDKRNGKQNDHHGAGLGSLQPVLQRERRQDNEGCGEDHRRAGVFAQR